MPFAMDKDSLIPVQRIKKAVLPHSGHKVILGPNLAQAYGIATKAI
jgi:hypothetical protein